MKVPLAGIGPTKTTWLSIGTCRGCAFWEGAGVGDFGVSFVEGVGSGVGSAVGSGSGSGSGKVGFSGSTGLCRSPREFCLCCPTISVWCPAECATTRLPLGRLVGGPEIRGHPERWRGRSHRRVAGRPGPASFLCRDRRSVLDEKYKHLHLALQGVRDAMAGPWLVKLPQLDLFGEGLRYRAHGSPLPSREGEPAVP